MSLSYLQIHFLNHFKCTSSVFSTGGFRADASFSMKVRRASTQSLFIACFHSFEHDSRGLASLWAHVSVSSSLHYADPLTGDIYKQILCCCNIQQSDKHINHALLTGLVGGDRDRHTLGCPCTAGLGDPVARVDDEGVVRVGSELAHHHPGGLQACLARREEHIGATGQAELRA